MRCMISKAIIKKLSLFKNSLEEKNGAKEIMLWDNAEGTKDSRR